MTLMPNVTKILRHWDRVRQSEADNPPAPAPKKKVIEVSNEGPWNFRVPKRTRKTGDTKDTTGAYKKQRCTYFDGLGCGKGDDCPWGSTLVGMIQK